MEKTLVDYRKSHFTETGHKTKVYGNFVECPECGDHAHFTVDGIMQRHGRTPESFEFVVARTGETIPRETVEALRDHPPFCLVPLIAELEVGGVRWGEQGYHLTTYGKFPSNEALTEFVNERNEKMGVHEVTWQTMQTCSMFDCWQNYNEIWLTSLKAYPIPA